MIKVLLLSTIAVFSMLLFGCSSDSTPPDPAPAPPPGRVRMIDFTGTVVFKSIEGGFYAIDGDSGEKYNPINLPKEFQKDGLHVKVSARPAEGMSIRMYGHLIEIIGIAAE